MRPVIPKVRVGDILLGTKNLRNWLQTASLVNYLSTLASHRNPKKGSLHVPTKKDRYVVAVNAWDTFAVWGIERDVVILFCNPVEVSALEGGIPYPSPRGRRKGPAEAVMSPGLFAQWFIRTRGKRPDLLNTWPDYAYYLWASLQMNAISSPRNSINYLLPPPTESPFTAHLHNEHGKGLIRERVEQAIRDGLPRHKQRRRSPSGGRAHGPSLQDIPRWKEKIRGIAANPRVIKKLRENVTLEVPQEIFNMVVSQLPQ